MRKSLEALTFAGALGVAGCAGTVSHRQEMTVLDDPKDRASDLKQERLVQACESGAERRPDFNLGKGLYHIACPDFKTTHGTPDPFATLFVFIERHPEVEVDFGSLKQDPDKKGFTFRAIPKHKRSRRFAFG